MSDVNWALAVPQGPSVADSYLKGFTTGQEIGKTRAVRNALARASSDPSGAQADLLAAGALPEANALASMQYQQQQRALLGAAYAKLGLGGTNAMTGQPATASAPTPAADPDATAAPGVVEHPSDGATPANIPHPTDLNPSQAAHALDMSHTFDALGLELSGLPYAQRAARLAEERPALLARGVPPQALDGFDPTDENIARIHGEMAQLRGQLPPTAPTMDATAPDQTPPPPPPPGQEQPTAAAQPPAAASGSPGFDIRDPNTQAGLQALAIADPQAAGPLINLGTAVMPKAEGQRPGTFRTDQSGNFLGPLTPDGKIMGTPNVDGSVPVYDPTTKTFSIMIAPGGAEAMSALATAKAAGQGAGQLVHAGDIAAAEAQAKVGPALQEAGGRQAITDQSTMVEVPNPDGSVTKGTMADYKAGRGVFAPGSATGPGHSQGAGEAEYAKNDAAAFSKTVATEGNPQSLIAYQNASTTARQAVSAAMALNPNEWTPAGKHLAEIGNAIHAATGLPVPGAKQATDLNYYASLIPQVTRTTFKTFPRLEKEFETVKAAIPGLQSPRDAAALTFATVAATNDRNAQFSQFVANYSGPHSQDALNKAFLASPIAKQSIFANPVFRTITVNGKPAVFISPAQHNGHTYGVFLPGTPQAQTFLVQ